MQTETVGEGKEGDVILPLSVFQTIPNGTQSRRERNHTADLGGDRLSGRGLVSRPSDRRHFPQPLRLLDPPARRSGLQSVHQSYVVFHNRCSGILAPNYINDLTSGRDYCIPTFGGIIRLSCQHCGNHRIVVGNIPFQLKKLRNVASERQSPLPFIGTPHLAFRPPGKGFAESGMNVN